MVISKASTIVFQYTQGKQISISEISKKLARAFENPNSSELHEAQDFQPKSLKTIV